MFSPAWRDTRISFGITFINCLSMPAPLPTGRHSPIKGKSTTLLPGVIFLPTYLWGLLKKATSGVLAIFPCSRITHTLRA
jgi:hypothetical protein